MDKLALKAFLLKIERESIGKAELNYSEYLEEIKHDWSGVEDIEDHSHVIESGEKTFQMESQILDHKKHLEIIDSISFEPMAAVDLGAVVKVNDKFFVVATAEPKFKFEGKTFMGISIGAPIYNLLRGKKVGDEFVFNGKTFKINEVH